MAFSRFKRVRQVPDVNLIPVMNLFVTLIPFLLLAAAFYHVSVIPTSLPSQTDGESDVETDLKAVTVNLKVEPNRIEVSASNPEIDEETLDEVALMLPKGSDGYDFQTLGKALFLIKQSYPNSDTVIVLPAEDVQYQDVVQVLDASREYTPETAQPKAAPKPKSGGIDLGSADDGEKEPLFPVVVLSRTV